jgi:hypothetical protein
MDLPKGTIRTFVNLVTPGPLLALPNVLGTLNIGMQVAVCSFPNALPRTPGAINDNAVVTDASQPYPVYGWLSYE